jgi:NMD protein affecting ribosome stability and mRNA decay
MAAQSNMPASLGARRDRTIQEYQHDTYKLRGKLKEPTTCPDCGALFQKGRWTWGTAPSGAEQAICPACHRIRDKYPMGLVTIKGSFKDEQRDQVIGLVKNEEEKEKKEHPLSRIMSIAIQREELVISTTDSHLPRRIGEALQHAYHGALIVHYDKGEEFVRVTWTK